MIEKMICWNFPHKTKINIYPVADVHLGSLLCNEREWKNFVKRIAAEEDSYIVLLGDLIDNSTRNSVGSPYDAALRPLEQKKLMEQYLTPLRDKILAITSGNHEARSMKDVDADLTEDIASKLDIEDRYRREICYVKISLGKRGDGATTSVFNLVLTHGAGGGSLTGASVNKNERFASIIENADVFIAAHTHKPAVTKPRRLVIDTRSGTVSERDVVVMTATSWLSYGGYAAAKMLLPSSSCNPQKLELSASEKNKKMQVVW